MAPPPLPSGSTHGAEQPGCAFPTSVSQHCFPTNLPQVYDICPRDADPVGGAARMVGAARRPHLVPVHPGGCGTCGAPSNCRLTTTGNASRSAESRCDWRHAGELLVGPTSCPARPHPSLLTGGEAAQLWQRCAGAVLWRCIPPQPAQHGDAGTRVLLGRRLLLCCSSCRRLALMYDHLPKTAAVDLSTNPQELCVANVFDCNLPVCRASRWWRCSTLAT